MIELIPTPVMTIDKDFNVTYMNQAGADVAGLGKEEVVGRKCYELFKTPHCRTDDCRCHQAMSKGKIASGETIESPLGGGTLAAWVAVAINETRHRLTRIRMT